jgi:integrase
MKISTIIRGGICKVSYTHQRKQTIFSTQYPVTGQQLNKEGRVRQSHTQHREINASINALYTKISQLVENLQRQGLEPTVSQIRSSMNTSSYDEQYVTDLYQDYIQRFTRQATITNNQACLKWLIRFAPHTPARTCTNQVWVDDYRDYLLGHMSDRSTHTRLTLTASMLRYYTERGLYSEGFRVRRFYKEKPVSALLSYEISYLKQVTMRSRAKQRTIDIFLLGYYTGCRYGDLSRLSLSHVDQGVLRYCQQKTGEWVSVPIHVHARELLGKLEGNFIHIAWFNQHIKEIFRELGLNRDIHGRPLHEVISSHWMRKTHTTIALKNNINVHEVMKNTGRSNYESMRRYIDMEDLEERKKNISTL